MGSGFTLGSLGVLLFHAAFSTIQCCIRVDIRLYAMYMWLAVPGNFQSIHPDSEENRLYQVTWLTKTGFVHERNNLSKVYTSP
ncbi:hypothetical protein Dimus_018806 [Dionaea muscipula]